MPEAHWQWVVKGNLPETEDQWLANSKLEGGQWVRETQLDAHASKDERTAKDFSGVHPK